MQQHTLWNLNPFFFFSISKLNFNRPFTDQLFWVSYLALNLLAFQVQGQLCRAEVLHLRPPGPDFLLGTISHPQPLDSLVSLPQQMYHSVKIINENQDKWNDKRPNFNFIIKDIVEWCYFRSLGSGQVGVKALCLPEVQVILTPLPPLVSLQSPRPLQLFLLLVSPLLLLWVKMTLTKF